MALFKHTTKHTCSLLAALLLGVTGALHAQSPAPEVPSSLNLTLDQCVEYALQYNLAMRGARLEIETARQQEREALSAGLPNLTGTFDLTRNEVIQRVFLPGVFFSGDANDTRVIPAEFGTRYTSTLSANFSQMVFDGTFFVALKASKALSEVTERSAQRTEVETAVAVMKSYYSAQVAVVNLGIARANIERLEKQVRDAEVQYRNGFAEKIDVDRIQVQLYNAETQLQNAELLAQLTVNQLKYQMGLRQDIELTLADQITPENRPNFREDLQKAFNYTTRIEYQLLQANRNLQLQDVAQYRVGYYPSVYLFANGGVLTGSNDLPIFNDSPWPGFFTYGVRVTIPIFDGFYKDAKVQQARVGLQRIDYELYDTENLLSLEYENARISMENAIRSLDLQERNVALAEEVLRVSQVRYREGVGSSLEVVDAESSLKEAQTNYLSALLDAYLAQVELKNALGIAHQPGAYGAD